MKYTFAKELTPIAATILQSLQRKVVSGESTTARKIGSSHGPNIAAFELPR
jgi:hypothetical protein